MSKEVSVAFKNDPQHCGFAFLFLFFLNKIKRIIVSDDFTLTLPIKFYN